MLALVCILILVLLSMSGRLRFHAVGCVDVILTVCVADGENISGSILVLVLVLVFV